MCLAFSFAAPWTEHSSNCRMHFSVLLRIHYSNLLLVPHSAHCPLVPSSSQTILRFVLLSAPIVPSSAHMHPEFLLVVVDGRHTRLPDSILSGHIFLIWRRGHRGCRERLLRERGRMRIRRQEVVEERDRNVYSASSFCCRLNCAVTQSLFVPGLAILDVCQGRRDPRSRLYISNWENRFVPRRATLAPSPRLSTSEQGLVVMRCSSLN